MRIVTGIVLAGTLLLGGVIGASAANPVYHEGKAAGQQISRGWHRAAQHGQKFLARHSWSRRRRAYHLRKAAGHAATARRNRARAGAEAQKARQ